MIVIAPSPHEREYMLSCWVSLFVMLVNVFLIYIYIYIYICLPTAISQVSSKKNLRYRIFQWLRFKLDLPSQFVVIVLLTNWTRFRQYTIYYRKTRIRCRAIPYDICGGQNGSWTGFPPRTLAFPFHHYHHHHHHHHHHHCNNVQYQWRLVGLVVGMELWLFCD